MSTFDEFNQELADSLINQLGQNPQCANNPIVVHGKSNYEIALEQGFFGTEAEWLESIKGAKGDRGEQGEQGDKGEQGRAGINGTDGIIPLPSVYNLDLALDVLNVVPEYTLNTADFKHDSILESYSHSLNLRIPADTPNSPSDTFPVGTRFTLARLGVGEFVFHTEDTVVLHCADYADRISKMYGQALLYKSAPNVWVIVGDVTRMPHADTAGTEYGVGDHTITLKAGIYDIALIGAGGYGDTSSVSIKTSDPNMFYSYYARNGGTTGANATEGGTEPPQPTKLDGIRTNGLRGKGWVNPDIYAHLPAQAENYYGRSSTSNAGEAVYVRIQLDVLREVDIHVGAGDQYGLAGVVFVKEVE